MVIEGKLHAKFETQDISATFKKRDFVIEYVDSSPLYPQYVSFQLVQDRVSEIDKFKIGEQIEVTFNLRGREWVSPEDEKKYFNTLEAWRIQKVEAGAGDTPATQPPVHDMADISSEASDDLPF